MNATERQQYQTNLAADFACGLGVLEILAGRPAVELSREEMLQLFAAFEAAYPLLAELQAAGQLQTGGVTLSPETRERITRIGALLRLSAGSAEADGAEIEIRSLAQECLRALAPPGP